MKRLIPLLLTLAVVAGACSGGDSANNAQTQQRRDVTLMLDWTPNTNHNGIYAAKAKGYYDAAGLNVNIIQPGEQGALPALGSGAADFAVTVQESLIPARAEGVPAVSIAAILATNTSSLMSLSSANINRPKDLENKTYGGFGGDLERQLISSLVKCDGGDPAKVKFVDVGDANYRVGLERKQYDFVWVFEGWDILKLRQEGVAINTIPFAKHFECIPDWYTPLLATTEKKIAEDPDLIRRFTEATSRGYADAIANPNAAADALLAGAPELDAKLVRGSSEYLSKFYAGGSKPWGYQDRDTWVRFEQFLRTSGLTTKPVDVDKAFTTQFLPK